MCISIIEECCASRYKTIEYTDQGRFAQIGGLWFGKGDQRIRFRKDCFIFDICWYSTIYGPINLDASKVFIEM